MQRTAMASWAISRQVGAHAAAGADDVGHDRGRQVVAHPQGDHAVGAGRGGGLGRGRRLAVEGFMHGGAARAFAQVGEGHRLDGLFDLVGETFHGNSGRDSWRAIRKRCASPVNSASHCLYCYCSWRAVISTFHICNVLTQSSRKPLIDKGVSRAFSI
jgi:hypothetical protein